MLRKSSAVAVTVRCDVHGGNHRESSATVTELGSRDRHQPMMGNIHSRRSERHTVVGLVREVLSLVTIEMHSYDVLNSHSKLFFDSHFGVVLWSNPQPILPAAWMLSHTTQLRKHCSHPLGSPSQRTSDADTEAKSAPYFPQRMA